MPLNGDVCVDDLLPILNQTRSSDLALVLELTPPRFRPPVAMAFADLTLSRWAEEAGLEEITVGRWLRSLNRIPFGAALRLAKVLGVEADLLFRALV